MIQKRTMYIVASIFCCLVVMVFAINGLGTKAKGRAKQDKVSIPAEQVIASIRTAVSAKSGNVLEIEAENEKGKLVCEVEILAQDGKTYEVVVDVATNSVVEIEADDDDDDDDDDDKDDNN